MAKLIAMTGFFGCISTAAMAYCPGGDPTNPIYQPGYYSPEKEFARSKFVVEAVLENQTWLGEDASPVAYTPSGSYIGTWYDLRIVRTLKGHPSARLRLFSENSTARFEFDKGKHYILFVDQWTFDPPIRTALTIDNCGNSGLAHDRLFRQLSRLAARKR